MATATNVRQHGEYTVSVSDRALGLILPQKAGRLLWAPMFLMAVMAFPIAFILGVVRANLVSTGTTIQDTANAAALGQYTTAVMFLGFASVFAAITFAIARILGAFRVGGGGVQETSRRQVLTLTIPMTAKGMILLMMMAMMMLLFAVVVHFVLGVVVSGAIVDGNQATVDSVNVWSTWIEGVRRLGTAVYLIGIALGLATIIQVLRFQAVRIRELVEEPTRDSGS